MQSIKQQKCAIGWWSETVDVFISSEHDGHCILTAPGAKLYVRGGLTIRIPEVIGYAGGGLYDDVSHSELAGCGMCTIGWISKIIINKLFFNFFQHTNTSLLY